MKVKIMKVPSQATAHIPYSFTVELPDDFKNGSKGFLLPANQISTVGRELWAATSVVSIFHTYSSSIRIFIANIHHRYFQLAKEAARHKLGPDPALVFDPDSYDH